CGECAGCESVECGECKFCLDMPKNGGPGKIRQVCIQKRCHALGRTPARVRSPRSELDEDQEDELFQNEEEEDDVEDEEEDEEASGGVRDYRQDSNEGQGD
ncbi:unnamed protein product, partial [Ectocarpus sp. 4 AP-2014]